LLKSSLTVCRGISPARSPKCAANAFATRPVAAASLSVTGKVKIVSNSGSFGEPLAWHSARTIRPMASSIRWRVTAE
jgi:hypothetical protein